MARRQFDKYFQTRHQVQLKRTDYTNNDKSRLVFERSFIYPERNLYKKNSSKETYEVEKKSTVRKRDRRRIRKLALLLPAHNEELIIETTIKSAISAGMNKRDIYVVDDFSSDNTRQIATNVLGRDNVIRVRRSGKAIAVNKAIKKFKIVSRYQWLHIADADSVFGKDYFRIYRRNLDPKKYAVAVGFVQSLRGNWISKYRAFTYTYSQHVYRRFQSYFGMISVFPGPITCFNTKIINKLDFDGGSLTEDFDITMQVHRKKLGKIKFIPKAVNYTQDPQTLDDFVKQNLRWQRGFFQGFKKFKIGSRPQAVDLGIMYQMVEFIFYIVQIFVIIPIILFETGRWQIIPAIFLIDFIVLVITAIISASITKRWSILKSIGFFYILRMIELGVFCQAFFEVVVLRRFKNSKSKGWDVANRRYEISDEALADTA